VKEVALTEADIEAFIALLQNSAELRERVRAVLIEDSLQRIYAALAQSAEDHRVFEAETRQFQGEMYEFRDQANERFNRIDERFDKVDSQLDKAELWMSDADRRLGRIDGRLGNVEGRQYEFNFRQNVASHLGARFRRLQPVFLGNYEPLHEAVEKGKISDEELTEILRLDLAVLGIDRQRPGGGQVLGAVELSNVVDRHDVERARRRADLIERAGLPAVACVAGMSITQGGKERAAALNVAVLIDQPEPDAASGSTLAVQA
jgi:hypothetical protein